MRNRTIPVKDTDFNEVQSIIIEFSDKNSVRWGLDEDWITNTLLPKQTEWAEAWTNYQDPAMRTPLITFTKNQRRKELEALLRVLVHNLEHNTKITDEDLRQMGIVIPSKNRTPNPAPTTIPEYWVDSGVIRCLGIHFRDNGSNTSAKPKGVHGVEIRWEFLDTPPVNVSDLLHSVFDTRTPYTFEFEESQRAKTVYFCLRWENTTGEKGPWGEIVSAIVP